jgi:tRNA(Arg) A34 adenosine deaminase TadA
MRQAIEKAREGIEAGETPFGAVIVCDGRLVSIVHNTVWRDTDPTAHAEINAIRSAARALDTIGLRGCEMFTTCEPCPMCLSAIHWAKIDRVIYGADIADAAAAGFSELRMPARTLAATAGSPLVVEGGLLSAECRELFRLWKERTGGRSY